MFFRSWSRFMPPLRGSGCSLGGSRVLQTCRPYGPPDLPPDNGFCCAENATGVVSGFGCLSSRTTVMLRRRVHPEPVEGLSMSG